jgi:hypothetical protein
MKVKELIELLQTMDPEAECVHCNDEEGNDYIRGLSASAELMSSLDADSYYLDYDPISKDDMDKYPDHYPADEYTIPCVVFSP